MMDQFPFSQLNLAEKVCRPPRIKQIPSFSHELGMDSMKDAQYLVALSGIGMIVDSPWVTMIVFPAALPRFPRKKKH